MKRSDRWHSDIELYMWIWKVGGIHRDRERWDSRLSYAENTHNFRRLDRARGPGRRLDDLASEIEECFPWYGIHDGDSLWAWLQATPCGRS